MLGLWAMMSKQNLIKKVMGMGIFQSAIILFYVSISVKHASSDIPIYPHDLIHPPHIEVKATSEAPDHHHEDISDHTETIHHTDTHDLAEDHHTEEPHASHGHSTIADQINPDDFDNPLPHVLMLTAIVVGVATLGVGLSLVQRIYRLYGSIEENEVLAAMTAESTENMTPASVSTANFEKNGSNHS